MSRIVLVGLLLAAGLVLFFTVPGLGLIALIGAVAVAVVLIAAAIFGAKKTPPPEDGGGVGPTGTG